MAIDPERGPAVLRCPACQTEITAEEPEDAGRRDPAADLTCPVCGAGLDPQGGLVHDPAIGP